MSHPQNPTYIFPRHMNQNISNNAANNANTSPCFQCMALCHPYYQQNSPHQMPHLNIFDHSLAHAYFLQNTHVPMHRHNLFDPTPFHPTSSLQLLITANSHPMPDRIQMQTPGESRSRIS